MGIQGVRKLTAPEAGDLFSELVVWIITEKSSGRFVGVFLKKEDAERYNDGVGSNHYNITAYLAT